jgi:hypothetical protein
MAADEFIFWPHIVIVTILHTAPLISIQRRGPRISGAIPPLLNTSSWRGAQLKEAQGQLYLLPLLHTAPVTLMSPPFINSELLLCLTKHHAMNGGIAPLILNLGTRWCELSQLHPPGTLLSWKEQVVHIYPAGNRTSPLLSMPVVLTRKHWRPVMDISFPRLRTFKFKVKDSTKTLLS